MTISSLTRERRSDPGFQLFTLLRIGCPACREEHASPLALVRADAG
jgi:hypothetical protein